MLSLAFLLLGELTIWCLVCVHLQVHAVDAFQDLQHIATVVDALEETFPAHHVAAKPIPVIPSRLIGVILAAMPRP